MQLLKSFINDYLPCNFDSFDEITKRIIEKELIRIYFKDNKRFNENYKLNVQFN